MRIGLCVRLMNIKVNKKAGACCSGFLDSTKKAPQTEPRPVAPTTGSWLRSLLLFVLDHPANRVTF